LFHFERKVEWFDCDLHRPGCDLEVQTVSQHLRAVDVPWPKWWHLKTTLGIFKLQQMGIYCTDWWYSYFAGVIENQDVQIPGWIND